MDLCCCAFSRGLPTGSAVCRQVLETAEFPPASYQPSAGSRSPPRHGTPPKPATQPLEASGLIVSFFFFLWFWSRQIEREEEIRVYTIADICFFFFFPRTQPARPPAAAPIKEARDSSRREGGQRKRRRPVVPPTTLVYSVGYPLYGVSKYEIPSREPVRPGTRSRPAPVSFECIES
jgi:hypothetical protein